MSLSLKFWEILWHWNQCYHYSKWLAFLFRMFPGNHGYGDVLAPSNGNVSPAVEQGRCRGWSGNQSLETGLSAFSNIDLLILKPTDGKCVGKLTKSLSILISVLEDKLTKTGYIATTLATLFRGLLSLRGVNIC